MCSGSRPSREGTRFVFAGGTVSLTMYPADGPQKDDKKKPDGREAKKKGAETSR